MFKSIIRFSLDNKLIVAIGVLALIVVGLYSASKIPLDAVPDITNNQVQIVTTAPTFAPQEVEQLITYPLESGMTNIPDVTEVRSISRYGLSVITIVFKDDVELMLARQYVQEQLNVAKAELPDGIEPELMPITTGLGEIYQYVLTVDKDHAHQFDATRLRTIQDWIVKRHLNGTKGIIETSSFGGYLKQYEVAIDPLLLKNYGITIQDVITALEKNNENSGGSYIEKESYSFYIRTEGRVGNLEAIGNIPIYTDSPTPILIKNIAQIKIGSAKRYGAMTMDGQGEVVGGITLMFKGDNSSEALRNVKERIETIKTSLPEGVSIYPYLDRSKLIGKTINTAKNNLIEGGLIVIFVLLLLLGNLRAGLIVASVIPLSMLFALAMMHYFGVSANLMSLGAIDFGIVIDGAVIIVEGLLHTLSLGYIGKHLSQSEMDDVVQVSTAKIYRSAAFGVLIILVVFIPILTLEGTEGKTFQPMAQTVGFAILGSLILSLTYVPVMCSLFLNKKIKAESGIALQIIRFLKKGYTPLLNGALNNAYPTLVVGVLAFVFSLIIFNKMGAEFIPTLEEGDIAMQQSIKPGSSLKESIHTSTMAEEILLKHFPEVEHVVSKIGTAEVPTDPMAIEDADIMIILKDKSEWTSADNRERLIEMMKEKLTPITWASFEFTQPIQLRFNELMTGAKSDVSVKIFGEDVEVLKQIGDDAAALIEKIDGAGDVKVDQTDGLQQLSIAYDRARMAQYGVSVSEVNQIIRAAYAGEQVGSVYEEERKFDLVVRLAPKYRADLDIDRLTVQTFDGQQVPIRTLAQIVPKEGPMLISREQARRFINVGVNVRNRDVASLVEAIQVKLNEHLVLPSGYEIQYGGQFENLQNARNRLLVAVPVALGLILLLLYLAFSSVKDVLIIFMAVPLSAIGGILALQLRGMPFSISSGIGFIALFGISVLNGIVLISAVKQLQHKDFNDLKSLIKDASLSRLRPVIMTALVAAFGFLPMALSTGSGAEVQQPLATVVIGGLVSSTLLTLLILPVLYYLFYKKQFLQKGGLIVLLCLTVSINGEAQSFDSFEAVYTYALTNHPQLKNQDLTISSAAVEKEAIGQWSPLTIDYQGGQINSDVYDHFFTVNQNINHLFGKKEQRAVIDSKLASLSFDKVLFANELKFSLRKAYDEWSFQRAKVELLDSILVLYQSLEPIVKLQYEAGETSLLDRELFTNKKIQLEQHRLLENQQAMAFAFGIRQLAYLSVDAILQAPRLEKLPFEEYVLDKDASLYVQTYQLKQDLLQTRAAQIDNSSRRPELSVGYFMQSLEKDFSFQGLQVGVGIPLDRRRSKTRVKQLDISRQELANMKEATILSYETKVQKLQEKLTVLQKYLSQYDQEVLPRHASILKIAQLQYQEGEIGFLPFSQIQERIFQEQQSYLEQIKFFNQTVLELSYLTQKNK